MKLYYAPGACSLADHIALHEAGLSFDHEKVDLKAKRTEAGVDFSTINPKGYVPALTLDSGETLSENIAILDWIAHQDSKLAPSGPMGHTHLLEALAFISTEIHKSFKPFFAGGRRQRQGESRRDDRQAHGLSGRHHEGRLPVRPHRQRGRFLPVRHAALGEEVRCRATRTLVAFRERMMTLPSVQKAMKHEGLS